MENLPAEWADKIDRVETMKNTDGTERIVAIQKSADPDKESRLRALQWDTGAGEWAPYEPQVGRAGWGFDINGESRPYWANDLVIPEASALGEPLSLADGTELPMGYLGRIYMTKDMERGVYYEFSQGYILDVRADSAGQAVLYTAFPLASGDWQVYVTLEPNVPMSALCMQLESLAQDDFGKYYMDAQLTDAGPIFSMSRLGAYFLSHRDELVGKAIIQGVTVNPNRSSAHDSLPDKQKFVSAVVDGGNPVDVESIQGTFDPLIIPAELWAEIAGK
jgi:hypothetical protein